MTAPSVPIRTLKPGTAFAVSGCPDLRGTLRSLGVGSATVVYVGASAREFDADDGNGGSKHVTLPAVSRPVTISLETPVVATTTNTTKPTRKGRIAR